MSRSIDNFDMDWPSPLARLVPRAPPPTPRTETPPHRPAPRLYRKPKVRDSPGKGKGLFATDKIPAYTEILVDEALVSLGPGDRHFELLEKYKLLPDEDQATFDTLSISSAEEQKLAKYEQYFLNHKYSAQDATKAASTIARFMSNGFKTGDPYGWVHVVFANVSRINHSCSPNALSHYRPNSGTQHIIALKELQPGDEIDICYCQMIMTRDQRQRRLQQWGFNCTCAACNGTLGDEYEQAIGNIYEWMEEDAAANITTRDVRIRESLIDALDDCINLAKMDDYPWLRAALPKLYDELSILNMPLPHMETRMHVVAAKREACEWVMKLNGADHPVAVARYNELLSLERAESS